MGENKVIMGGGINPAMSAAPRSGYKKKVSNRVKQAWKLGYWWVQDEKEAELLISWEVSK